MLRKVNKFIVIVIFISLIIIYCVFDECFAIISCIEQYIDTLGVETLFYHFKANNVLKRNCWGLNKSQDKSWNEILFVIISITRVRFEVLFNSFNCSLWLKFDLNEHKWHLDKHTPISTKYQQFYKHNHDKSEQKHGNKRGGKKEGWTHLNI